MSDYDKLLMSFLYPQANWRFVERDSGGRLETGVFHYPFRDFTSGAADVPTDGALWVQPGTYPAVGISNKAMTVKTPLGDVILRD
ncbi:MAG: hypothetical protein JSV84_17870 [Gemmatimonadota bacterium]|nr:MAG: hypothetical protein JSV84_17870 [Gemmatimonadota bacterium]